MKIPAWLASLSVAALLGLEGWTLNEVVSLEKHVSAIEAKIDLRAELSAK